MKELCKTVKVSDPECWYGKKTIKVQMFILPAEPDTVRIFFESVDDFAIYRDVNEWGLEANWNWAKEWLYDKIPDTVSCTWLHEHGYMPY